jgi:hypothetical protein
MRQFFMSLAIVGALACTTSCSRADDAAIDRIRSEAAAAHPSDPVAATRAANEALERRAEGSTALNPKEVAAHTFLGYYTKNSLETPSVCKEYGVNLGAFASAFVEANRVPFEAASALVDAKSIIERARMKANINARSELERFAAAEKTDVRGACSFIQKHSLEMADGTKFANIMPRLYVQLVGEQK